MAKEYRKPRGRPASWYNNITAPPEALALYKAIGQVQKSTAFEACHTYHGASLGGEPMINFNQKTTRLANVVASYIGIESGRKQCDTPNCCNPFHYIPPEGEKLVAAHEVKERVIEIGLEEWVDLVEYYMDKHEVKPDHVTFDEMRPLVMLEDLSDEQLVKALAHMKEKENDPN